MKTLPVIIASTIFQLLPTSVVYAASTDIIDHGTYLSDSVSGLDWLDVTLSVNRSQYDVSSQFGNGGDYAGYRYATGVELNTLVARYTGTDTGVPLNHYVDHSGDVIDGLIRLLGSTTDSASIAEFGQTVDARYGYAEGEFYDITNGIIADIRPDLGIHYFYTALLQDIDSTGHINEPGDSEYSSDRSRIYNGTFSSLNTGMDTGSYLVRDTVSSVPVPAAVWLMGSGLLGLMGFSRRNKVQPAA